MENASSQKFYTSKFTPIIREDDKGSEEEINRKKSPSIIKGVMYYFLPLISIAVFFGLLIFGTIPSVKNILSSYSDKKEKGAKIKGLDREILLLEELKSKEDTINSDLYIIDKIVPSEKTQVAKFVGEIEAIALNNNLRESKYQSGEQIQQLQREIEQKQESSVAIVNIPSASEYIAGFENMKKFLNDLYNKDDFIIVRSMTLEGGAAREVRAKEEQRQGKSVTLDTSLANWVWDMKVTFEKYQFSKGFKKYIDENLVSITEEADQVTLDFLRERYGS